jgi:hypothetical protein
MEVLFDTFSFKKKYQSGQTTHLPAGLGELS